ncbi:MAG: signal peptidase II [Eubacteriales bacterium]
MDRTVTDEELLDAIQMDIRGKRMTKRVKYNLTGLIGTVLLVAFDQWTKLLAIRHLMGQAAVPILDGVFELHYLENQGAAFGILQGQKGVFLLCTAFVLVVMAFYYNRLPVTGRFTPAAFGGRTAERRSRGESHRPNAAFLCGGLPVFQADRFSYF